MSETTCARCGGRGWIRPMQPAGSDLRADCPVCGGDPADAQRQAVLREAIESLQPSDLALIEYGLMKAAEAGKFDDRTTGRRAALYTAFKVAPRDGKGDG